MPLSLAEQRLPRRVLLGSQEDPLQQKTIFELLTRLGFVARAILYLVTGVLVIGAGRAEDASGVFQYLGGGSGKWLLTAMAGGFFGYGLWRLADAVLGIESAGRDDEWLKRGAAAVSGAVHLYLANQSLDVAEGAARLSENAAQQQAQNVLAVPGGQILLGAVAAVLAGAGLYQLAIAARCSFLDKLDQRVRESWVKWLGRAGYAARGAVFLIAAYFAALATLSNRSSRVGGVEQALEWLSSPNDMIIAAGLMLFGVYGLIEARYRRIHSPHLRAIGAQVRDSIPS